jgi:peptide/nickel transport system ATP-binding protein
MLAVEHLSLGVPSAGGLVPAVSDVSFALEPGRVLGLVGESGCGKTITAQSIQRLGEHQGIGRMQGRMMLDGSDIFAMDESEQYRRTTLRMRRS